MWLTLPLLLAALVLSQVATPIQAQRPPSQRPPTPAPRQGPILAEAREMIGRAIQAVPSEESANEERLLSIRRALEVMDRSDSLDLVKLEALSVVVNELADMIVGSTALFPSLQSAISEFHLMLMRGIAEDGRAEAAQRLLIDRLRSDLAPPPAQ